MFIRQTRINNKVTGEGYFTFRLVRSERIGGKVRQITVLNRGRTSRSNRRTGRHCACVLSNCCNRRTIFCRSRVPKPLKA